MLIHALSPPCHQPECSYEQRHGELANNNKDTMHVKLHILAHSMLAVYLQTPLPTPCLGSANDCLEQSPQPHGLSGAGHLHRCCLA
jgi:hypothetical protein